MDADFLIKPSTLNRHMGQFQKHLHTLANLARLPHKQDFRDGL
jgi:hypothetical protein